MSTRVLIVEDEPIIADDIALTLGDLGFIVTNMVNTTEWALKAIEEKRPDVILLDIKIKGDKDGIRLAHEINERYELPFVFLSSLYDENTIQRAKSADPGAYVVKPFKEQDLKVAIELALTKKKSRQVVEAPEPNLFVRKSGAIVPLNFEKVTHVEADDNYSIFHEPDEKHVVTHTLKEIEQKLMSAGFCRIHKSFLVNIKKIDRIEHSVVFIEETMLPIGKAYRKPFFERLTVF